MWAQVRKRLSARLWLSAGVASALLLLAVLSQVDFSIIERAWLEIRWPLFATALVLLMAEGFATAARMQVFTPGFPDYRNCLKISAWYVLYLLILPARLGEIVSVILLRRYAGQRPGPGLANLLTQRLFDLMMLSAVFILLVVLVSGMPLDFIAFVAAPLLCILFGVSILWLERMLAVAARIVQAMRRRSTSPLLKAILRLVLQARIWRRHYATRDVMLRGALVTLLKWFANLGGLTLLFMALQIPVSVPQALLLSAAFNFLAIVPVQTIGGIGVSEVGLTTLLVMLGSSLEYAASMSLVVRAVLVVTPPLYWSLVMSLTAALAYWRPRAG